MAASDHHAPAALEKMIAPIYFIAIVLVVLPVVDLVTNVLPLQVGDVAWRYGAVGLSSGFLLTPLLGVAMLGVAAAYAGHVGVLRVIAVAGLLVAVLLLGASAMFVLDALQLRGAVQPVELRGFDIGVVKALVKNFAGIAALGWLGIASLLAARRADRSQRARRSEPPTIARATIER